MRNLTIVLGLLVGLGTLGSSLAGCDKVKELTGIGGSTDLKSNDHKTLYALGQMIGGNVKTFALNEAELMVVVDGIRDAINGEESKVKMEEFGPKVQELAKARGEKQAELEKKRSKSFVEKLAKQEGAEKLASGLLYIEKKAGNGKAPQATDKVKVHYHGTLTDGTVFDSSKDRGEPVEFPLNRVIPCWTEGVQKMKVGGSAQLVCPADIAYGERGRPPKIPGGATLVFDVELLEIKAEDPAAAGAMSITPPQGGLKIAPPQPKK